MSDLRQNITRTSLRARIAQLAVAAAVAGGLAAGVLAAAAPASAAPAHAAPARAAHASVDAVFNSQISVAKAEDNAGKQ